MDNFSVKKDGIVLTQEEKEEEKDLIDKINYTAHVKVLVGMELARYISNLFIWVDIKYGKGKRKSYWEKKHKDGIVFIKYPTAIRYGKIGDEEVEILEIAKKNGYTGPMTFNVCERFRRQSDEEDQLAMQCLLLQQYKKRKLKQKEIKERKKKKNSQ